MGISDDIRPKRREHLRREIKVEKTFKPAEPQEIETKPVAEKIETKPVFTPVTDHHKGISDQFFADMPAEKPRATGKKSRHTGLLIFMWLLIFGAIIAYALYQNWDLFKKTSSSSASTDETGESYAGEVVTQDYAVSSTPASTISSTSEAATTPAPSAPTQTAATIDKTAVTIKVLNGNGVKGDAQKVTDLLTAVGFKIASTGNAKNFSYTETVIYYQTGKESEAKLIQAALVDYTSKLELSDTIAKDQQVVVVVGDK